MQKMRVGSCHPLYTKGKGLYDLGEPGKPDTKQLFSFECPLKGKLIDPRDHCQQTMTCSL